MYKSVLGSIFFVISFILFPVYKSQADLLPLPIDVLGKYEDYRRELLNKGWIPSPDPLLNKDVPGLPEVICGNRLCTASFISQDKTQGLTLSLWFTYPSGGDQKLLYVAPSFDLHYCAVESLPLEGFHCL